MLSTSRLKLLVLYFAFGPSFFHLSAAWQSSLQPTVTSTLVTQSVPVTDTPSPVTQAAPTVIPTPDTLPPLTAPLSGLGFTAWTRVSYQENPTFSPIPPAGRWSPISIPSEGSFRISDNVLAVMETMDNIIISRDSCPDTSNLPSDARSLTVLSIESTTCPEPCSVFGTCQPNGKCACSQGFVGDWCENCDKGHFGQECYPCPTDCKLCDDGLTGSGSCDNNPPSTCNCVHGLCDSSGQCKCHFGWTTAPHGTAQCTECQSGHYYSSAADNCEACPAKCAKCKIRNAYRDTLPVNQLECTTCLSGFSLLSDGTCTAKTGGCHPGHFLRHDGTCAACSPLCTTCEGTANYCLSCPPPLVASRGNCCPVGMFKVTNTATCVQCHPECTTCSGPSFKDCDSCPPFYPVKAGGRCSKYCKKASQYWDRHKLSCQPCDSTCSTCSGSGSHQCLSCPGSTSLQEGSCK